EIAGGDPAEQSSYAARKSAAMAAHATQVAVDGPWFALSNDLGQPLLTTEYYELVRGTPGAPAGERETDLFAGLPDEGLPAAGLPAEGEVAGR
ncbi:hypothetical protein ACFWEN_42030, partial [Streptomyces anthocyanicus]